MRRSKKYDREFRPLNTHALMGYTRYEIRGGLEYKVHHIKSAAKEYICPGCGGRIVTGESHEVAWTEEHLMGARAGQEARRHWHTSCWSARGGQGRW
ncbi:ATP/GTP-binding protein [Arcanobacterium canis]|uniref:ATP/GTP-binding protein n=1 Tax=Arcanobacterium canis TaxID=999183 RepID=A0ABY8FWY8_9ACTO|nr:ATP/GTP-binding protein [Arcanobacterium canis]WFM83032.1 ATP/GTP-binding protein [Arcanobacterium canis]